MTPCRPMRRMASGFNNANFSTPPDGSAPPDADVHLRPARARDRDGDLDAEIVLHEYTHGLSDRLVGGGRALERPAVARPGRGVVGLLPPGSAERSRRRRERQLRRRRLRQLPASAVLRRENYYFGIRRYPYSTDMAEESADLQRHRSGAGRRLLIRRAVSTGMFGSCGPDTANEVHNQGEVWCVMLWEARANLIDQHGWATGNRTDAATGHRRHAALAA